LSVGHRNERRLINCTLYQLGTRTQSHSDHLQYDIFSDFMLMATRKLTSSQSVLRLHVCSELTCGSSMPYLARYSSIMCRLRNLSQRYSLRSLHRQNIPNLKSSVIIVTVLAQISATFAKISLTCSIAYAIALPSLLIFYTQTSQHKGVFNPSIVTAI
jgi:hypothetical protein